MSSNYDDIVGGAGPAPAPAGNDYDDVVSAPAPPSLSQVAKSRFASKGNVYGGVPGPEPKTTTSADTLGGALNESGLMVPMTSRVVPSGAAGMPFVPAPTGDSGFTPGALVEKAAALNKNPDGMAKAAHGILQVVGGAGDFLTSPLGAATLGAGAAGAAGGVAGQVVKGAATAGVLPFMVQSAKDAYQGITGGDIQQAARGVAGLGVSALPLTHEISEASKALHTDLTGAGPQGSDLSLNQPGSPQPEYPVLDQVTSHATPYEPPPVQPLELNKSRFRRVQGEPNMNPPPEPEMSREEADMQVAQAQADGVQQAKRNALDKNLAEIDARAKSRGIYDDVVGAPDESVPDTPAGPAGRSYDDLAGYADGTAPETAAPSPAEAGDVAAQGVPPDYQAEEIPPRPVPPDSGRADAHGPEPVDDGLIADLGRRADEARARLAERRAGRTGTVMGSGLGGLNDVAEDLPDLAMIGAHKIASGVSDFGTWAKQMADEHGIDPDSDEAKKLFDQSRLVLTSASTRGDAPAGGDKNVGLAKDTLREMGATHSLEQLRLQRQLKPMEQEFDTQMRTKGKQANYDFMSRMERGDLSDPRAASLRKVLDSARERVQALGNGALDDFIENYFPHQWEDPAAAAQAIRELRKSPLEGSKSFLKHRTVESIEAGMLERGLVPKWDNPIDAVRLKVAESDRYVYAQKAIMQGVKDGWIREIEGERPPPGYTKINVSGGHYMADPEVAKVFNNYLSPGLAGRGDNIGTIYRGYMRSASFLNQAQLGLSAFHATGSALNSMISTVALGTKQLFTDGQRMSGVGNIIKGTLPTEPLLQLVKGNRLMREVMAERGITAEMLQKGGGRVGMEHWYFNNSAGRFMRALRRGEYGKAALGTIPAAIESANKLVMQYTVPRLKIAAFIDMAQHEVERLGPDATDQQVRHAYGKAWDSVDNRFGQLVYDNLFWNKAIKDLGLASVRSLGWNVGTVQDLGGGLKDYATVGSRFGGNTPFRDAAFTHRMAYVAALPFVTGLYGAIYGYLHGNPPQTLQDYYHPHSGETNEDGTQERVNLPTYMKEVTGDAHAVMPGGRLHTKGVIDVVASKTNPLLQTVIQTLENKDFFDHPIRNEQDPAVQQMKQYADYLSQQLRPFSTRTQGQEQGPERKVEQFGGITHAPKWSQDGYKPPRAAKRSPYGPQE